MNLVFPRLYAILDSSLLTTSELVLAETLAGSGVERIQYRNKKAPSRDLFEISLRLSTAMAQRDVRFIVNDRPDIALLSGAGAASLVPCQASLSSVVCWRTVSWMVLWTELAASSKGLAFDQVVCSLSPPDLQSSVVVS